MKTIDSEKITIKLLDINTISEQVKVYCSSFGSNIVTAEALERWKKKHYDNPIGQSYVFGAFVNGEMVSINAYMPLRYIYKGSVFRVVQSCESGTLVSYRGKGIWRKLVETAMDYFITEGNCDFVIGFPNYANSFPGFLSMGWTHCLDVKNYMLVLNWRNLFKSMYDRIKKKIPTLRHCAHYTELIPELEKSMENSISLDDYIPNFFYDDSFALIIDNDFLSWKKNYKGLKQISLLNNEGKIIANCSYYLKRYANGNGIDICHFVVNNDNSTVRVGKRVIKAIKKLHPECAFIRAWAVADTENEKYYKRLFFMKMRHHNPFVVLTFPPVDKETITDVNKWNNVSFFDLD